MPRKVMFMINDKLVSTEQALKDAEVESMFDYSEEDNGDDQSVDTDSEEKLAPELEQPLEKKEFFLDELEQIDQLYEKIENRISALAI